MVIDTSAIIAVLLNEANAAAIAQAIESGSPRLLSAANFLEASIVIESRKGEAGGRELDLLLYRAAIEVVAVDQDQAEIARLAWRRFGKCRDPARLNYRDCFAYALAKTRRLPLLFQGDDFSRTDIEPVALADANKSGR
jgi:ribonuclease VapC